MTLKVPCLLLLIFAFRSTTPTSIAVDPANNGSIELPTTTTGSNEMEVDPLLLDARLKKEGPSSVEDMASKEKDITTMRPGGGGGYYYHHLKPLVPPPPSASKEIGSIVLMTNSSLRHSHQDEEEEDEDEETEEEEEEEEDEDDSDETAIIAVLMGNNETLYLLPTLNNATTHLPIKTNVSTTPPPTIALPQIPIPQAMKSSLLPYDQELDEKLFLILQNAVRETYFSFRDILGARHTTQMKTMEDDLRKKLSSLDVDLNVKIVALDTTTHSRIQTLTDQIIDQRKEDIQTFSDNLNQLQKTHQMHMDAQKVEIQQLQVTMDLMNKGQSTLNTKITQMQKQVNNLDSKINDMVVKSSQDLTEVQDNQKLLTGVLSDIQLTLKTNDAEFREMQEVVGGLQKSAHDDHGKLRRTLIRDQKQEPLQVAIRHLKNKNVGAALKQWKTIESIADDLKETLPGDIAKIVDECYGKNAVNLAIVADFIHKAVASGDRRLKESAYGTLLQDMDPNKSLTDAKRTIEIFNLAQTMKADLGMYYNSSSTTAEIVGRLPSIIKLITFDKVKLYLPTRGYLRVAPDRKVSLVPPDGRFYAKDETLWHFEYDKDKADGTFYIKSDKLQKYLVTLQEGFNSYGFSKQGLFVTGNKRENGTRFLITIVNQGEYILLKSVFYNGYLTWKSNVQTVYGDDESYFLLLVDRKNGPSPYWVIQTETDD